MRSIGLDVHRDFCEVAIFEDGKVTKHRRVRARRAGLAAFALSLRCSDQVGLEATGSALAVAWVIEPHVVRVVVANAAVTNTIGAPRAKTDQFDVRTLGQLLGTGFFALGEELERLDQAITRAALGDRSIQLLVTVPGVNLTTASAFMAAVGDIGRFESPSQLASYLGLDPKVHQSGISSGRHGSISKQGCTRARRPWSSRHGWSLGLPDRCAPSPSASGNNR